MRRPIWALLLLGIASLSVRGAQITTPNFIVTAQDPQVAQMVAKYAEHYRKQRALDWLGREMTQWPQPCPLQVKISMQGPRGATTFRFGNNVVMEQSMQIEGQLERLINSVLPHEITHTVFAYHFRRPLPRWADEGGSVLSEDDLERDRHDKLTKQLLSKNRLFPLRTLMGMMQYPNNDADTMKLYAQGFSVVDYLVKRNSRQAFLNFMAQALAQGWDGALQSHYGLRNIEEMEAGWLASLQGGKIPSAPTQPNEVFAAAGQKKQGPGAGGRIVRMTVPTYGDAPPVYRGSSPSNDQMGQRFGQGYPPRPNEVGMTPPIQINPNGWRPASTPTPQPNYVQPPAPQAPFPGYPASAPQYPQPTPPQYPQPYPSGNPNPYPLPISLGIPGQ